MAMIDEYQNSCETHETHAGFPYQEHPQIHEERNDEYNKNTTAIPDRNYHLLKLLQKLVSYIT